MARRYTRTATFPITDAQDKGLREHVSATRLCTADVLRACLDVALPILKERLAGNQEGK